jgi:hypothetical protein
VVSPRPVARQTCEIADKIGAGALSASQRIGRRVFLARMFALAGRSPGVHIKILAPDEPIHAALLRPRGDKGEAFAGTVLASCVLFLAEEGFVVLGEEMAAETFGELAQAGALGPLHFVPVGDLLQGRQLHRFPTPSKPPRAHTNCRSSSEPPQLGRIYFAG